MTKNNKPWIDVYPFDGRNLEVINDKKEVELSEELSKHVSIIEEPAYNSFVPFTSQTKFDKDIIKVYAGVMPFKTLQGINDSIEKNSTFAPKSGYNPCLSVGFLTATKDGKVIFQRRPENVHCPNILIHEPCGYMASGYVLSAGEKCDDPQQANNPKLYNINTQLDVRKKEIAKTFNLPSDLVSYEQTQDFLACGWKTIEMYFSTTGKIDAKSTELEIPKNQEIFFVPFEHLKDLIYNQGKLARINANGYRPKDPKQIPLIDESLIGLVYGYEKMTGEKLDIPETIDRLNKSGLEIKVYDTSPGKTYEFPSKF